MQPDWFLVEVILSTECWNFGTFAAIFSTQKGYVLICIRVII